MTYSERSVFRNGKETNHRQRIQKYYIFLTALPLIISSADFVWYGGPLYYRSVQRRGTDYRRLYRQLGYAYADCHDRRACHGIYRNHRQGGWDQTLRTCLCHYRQYSHPVYEDIRRYHRITAALL